MLISVQLSSKLSNQKSEEGISKNMGGTCVRRSLLLTMILNIVVLVVQADDPPASSLLPPSSVLTVPHFPSPYSQQDHTHDWKDCFFKWLRHCIKNTSPPKVLRKKRWGWGMYRGCAHLIKKLCKVPSDLDHIAYRCAVNRFRFPSKAVGFGMKSLYIPSLSLSFHFMVYASTRRSMHRYTYGSTHISSHNFIFLIFDNIILIL
jgi:hypothetical protein